MIDLPAGTRLVLASASPRRAQLLRSVGLDPEVRPADLDEAVRRGESPARYVRRLSLDKAAAVARPGELVLAADTTVEVGGEILGKPADEADLRRMLGLLSGITHRVHTGVSVTAPTGGTRSDVVTTEVTFVELDGPTTDWYVAHGESVDKAGGYAMQGAGAALVARVDGSVTNVIGLPLAESLALLRSALR
jgi:septum formation protein